MPKVAYSEEDRTRIREALITTALELMAKQGIQHTTVEQIYREVGISRTFFLLLFSYQRGPDRGDAVSAAAACPCLCAKTDGGPWTELAGRSEDISLYLLLR